MTRPPRRGKAPTQRVSAPTIHCAGVECSLQASSEVAAVCKRCLLGCVLTARHIWRDSHARGLCHSLVVLGAPYSLATGAAACLMRVVFCVRVSPWWVGERLRKGSRSLAANTRQSVQWLSCRQAAAEHHPVVE